MLMRLAFVLLLTVARSVVGQETARLIATEPPDAELPYEFSQISRIFELRDGRVIVLDRLDGNVRLADLRTGVSSVVGRIGNGPGEYRAPHDLIPLGGDSVGVVDGT